MKKCNCLFNENGTCFFDEAEENCEYQINKKVVKAILNRTEENTNMMSKVNIIYNDGEECASYYSHNSITALRIDLQTYNEECEADGLPGIKQADIIEGSLLPTGCMKYTINLTKY